MDVADKPQGSLVKVYTCESLGEAHTVVLFLADRDIPAVIAEDAFITMPRVFVGEEFEEKALHVLQEFEQFHRASEKVAPSPEEEFDEPDQAWKEWPRCPSCSRRRTAECPLCNEARDDFPLSENNAAENQSSSAGNVPPVREPLVVLRCTCCSGLFRPIFRRTCEGCGFAFADGIGPPANTPGWLYIGGFFLLGIAALVMAMILVRLGMVR